MKKEFLRVLLGGHKIMSRLGFSIVRGPLDEDAGELIGGDLYEEELSSFLFAGLSYSDFEFAN